MSAVPPFTSLPPAGSLAVACEACDLIVELGGRRVVGPLDLRIPQGSFLGILGPNGSGKTTLLRALTGSARPSSGDVLLWNKPLDQYRALELARLVGVVPQTFNLDFSFTVREMVAMGRYAHSGRRIAVDDRHSATAVAAALETTGVEALADRLVTELSGGERQRALIAQTLAQETPILLLDEPLNNLDLNHQLEVMQLLARLHSEGRTIAVVLHDLNMAAQYCDELVLLDQGCVAARGRPESVLDPRTILEVFKVRVAVHDQGRRPYLTPLWSHTYEESAGTAQARVHVIAGGGAASALLEELVARGFTPTVGIVSVFDTDYAAAERYELEVVSAPPFEPHPAKAIEELDAMVDAADAVIVAPIFFGRGNLAPLRTALRATQSGKRVILIGRPPLGERDLSGGEASALISELLAAGALEVTGPTHAIEQVTAP